MTYVELQDCYGNCPIKASRPNIMLDGYISMWLLSLVSIFIFRRYLWGHIFKLAISVFPFISIFSVCLFVQSCKSSDFPTPLQSSKCRKCCCRAKFVKLNLPPTRCHYFWIVNTLYQNLRTNRTLFSTPSSFWTRANNRRSRTAGFEPVSLESWVLYSSAGSMPWRTFFEYWV